MAESTRTEVKCNDCEHVFVTGYKKENIEAGKCKCKGEVCESTSMTIIGPAKPIAPDPTESAEERTIRQDANRKDRVDVNNAEKEIAREAEEDALANVPLKPHEKAFCDKIGALMNVGRRQNTPAAADIFRYSRLKKRLDVK